MLIQISSGQGPAECELAVGLLAKELRKKFPDIEVVKTVSGREKNCYSSIVLKSETDLFGIWRHGRMDLSKSISTASQAKKLVHYSKNFV